MPAPDRRFDTAACDRTMPREGWLRAGAHPYTLPAHRTALLPRHPRLSPTRRHKGVRRFMRLSIAPPRPWAAPRPRSGRHGRSLAPPGDPRRPGPRRRRAPRRARSHVGLLALAGQHIVARAASASARRSRSWPTAPAGRTSPAPALAAAVELIPPPLIHDDINDRSDTRRGRSTVNSLWGDNLASSPGISSLSASSGSCRGSAARSSRPWPTPAWTSSRARRARC